MENEPMPKSITLTLTTSEWVNLTMLATSLYQMLKSGRAQFPPGLLWRTNGTKDSQKAFAADLIKLRNVLSKVVDPDGVELPGASPRDLDRLSATFIMEEVYALHWCITVLLRMLADDNPTLPAEVFEEDIRDKILLLLLSATEKLPIHNQNLLLAVSEEAVTILRA